MTLALKAKNKHGKVASIFVASVVLVAFSACRPAAEPLKIQCEREDTTTPGWDGPMEVTYNGEASGTLSVTSAHIELSLPATKEVRTGEVDGKPHSVTGITGNAEVQAIMPDLAALDTCVASTIQPEFKGDADMYAVATMSCLAKAPMGTVPVPITAAVSVALVPSENNGPSDVVVEIKRTYAAKSASPSGVTSIDSFPRCSLAEK